MGKELLQKAIEAGIVPAQSVKLLQMWRALPDDLPEAAKMERTQQQVLELVEELGDLLEQDQEIPEMKETELDLDAAWEKARTVQLVYRLGQQHLTVRMPAGRTRQGGFFFRYVHQNQEVMIRTGGQITDQDNAVFEITQVSPRYVEDALRYLVCDVQEVPDYAQVRGMPGNVFVAKPQLRRGARGGDVSELPAGEAETKENEDGRDED